MISRPVFLWKTWGIKYPTSGLQEGCSVFCGVSSFFLVTNKHHKYSRYEKVMGNIWHHIFIDWVYYE